MPQHSVQMQPYHVGYCNVLFYVAETMYQGCLLIKKVGKGKSEISKESGICIAESGGSYEEV